MMLIRSASIDDSADILSLFRNTVQHINAADYAKDQIEVWANAGSLESFQKKIHEQYFLVAEEEGAITGFSSLG